MFVTYKWNINNLANTIFSIANLNQPDTRKQTQNAIKIWHIVVTKKLKPTYQLP